jgi:hypothetical protein
VKTDHLARLYDQLTPRERLPLIMAAHLRGDTAEQKRLAASARKQTYQVPDYYPLAKALDKACHWHLLTVLDLAGLFWQWWGLWTSDPRLHVQEEEPRTRGARRAATHRKKRERRDAELIEEYRTHGIMRYYASRFVAHVDAWKQFSTELHIVPEAPLQLMIGWGLVTQTEKVARHYVFSAEQAAAFLSMHTAPVPQDATLERGPAPIETAADLARDWHVILEKLLHNEGGA